MTSLSIRPARYGYFICCFEGDEEIPNSDFLDWVEEAEVNAYEAATPTKLVYGQPIHKFNIKLRRDFHWSALWFMVDQTDAVHMKLRWAEFLK